MSLIYDNLTNMSAARWGKGNWLDGFFLEKDSRLFARKTVGVLRVPFGLRAAPTRSESNANFAIYPSVGTRRRNVLIRNPEFCWSGVEGTDSWYCTNVTAITGPDAAYEIRDKAQLKDCDDLIVLIEVANSDRHWASPGDLNVDALPSDLTSGVHGDGVTVLFLDGSVEFLSNRVPLETLKNFTTATGARKHDRETELAPYAIKF